MDSSSTSWIYIIITSLCAFGALVWKIVTVVSRITHLEQRISSVEDGIILARADAQRLEDKIFNKLDGIEKKLDTFIMDSIKK